MMSRRWFFFLTLKLLVLVCAVIALYLGRGFFLPDGTPSRNPAGAGPARPPQSVSVAQVALRDAQEYQQFAGTVQSRISVQISSRIVAHILEITVHSGQQVKKDEVLVRLDDSDVRTKIKQTEAGVGIAEAAVRAAEANLNATKAGKVEADQDLKRFQELFKAGAAPEQQLQQAEAKAKTAQANVERAQENIAEAQKEVARARAYVQEAQANLDYTVIRSPMDGVVIDKQAEPGDLAAPGRSLITLQSPTALRFEAPVSESCARRITLGDRVRVQVDAAQLSLPAEVNEIVPAVDPKSRSFLVRADLPAQPALRPGLFGRLQFPCASRPTLSMPAAALLTRGQLDLAFAVTDGHAVLRLITIGRSQGGWIEVLSGLSAGDRVVLSPPPELHDGDPVQVQPEAK
ncbi:MAG: efflux RND transporter periplasmic adaptor subunit [Planctomycetota bacterium]|nr:efflux RND transporter periplasmic adaptor subunit [Planctomycetota bacterium]